MGFTVYYRSTRPIPPSEAEAVKQAAKVACHGRTWLGCEPVRFFSGQGDDRLLGGSKPNFQPHPRDAAAAANEGLPDGTVRDMLDVLGRLSRDFSIDWEINHDHSDGPVGFIRGGPCDEQVLSQVEAFADLGDILSADLDGLIDQDLT